MRHHSIKTNWPGDLINELIKLIENVFLKLQELIRTYFYKFFFKFQNKFFREYWIKKRKSFWNLWCLRKVYCLFSSVSIIYFCKLSNTCLFLTVPFNMTINAIKIRLVGHALSFYRIYQSSGTNVESKILPTSKIKYVFPL